MIALSDQVLDVPRVRFDNRDGRSSDRPIPRRPGSSGDRLHRWPARSRSVPDPAGCVPGGHRRSRPSGAHRRGRVHRDRRRTRDAGAPGACGRHRRRRGQRPDGDRCYARDPRRWAAGPRGCLRGRVRRHPLAAYGPVPLTTMRVPTHEMGRAGALMVLAALDGDRPSDVVLTGEIVDARLRHGGADGATSPERRRQIDDVGTGVHMPRSVMIPSEDGSLPPPHARRADPVRATRRPVAEPAPDGRGARGRRPAGRQHAGHRKATIDWETTLAFRRHLWSWGLPVAEAMDTAQRGMGLDWARHEGVDHPLDRRSQGRRRCDRVWRQHRSAAVGRHGAATDHRRVRRADRPDRGTG